MKPLNQPERRTRLWQFSLLYLLALLVPLGASYYLFSNSSIADENARLKLELDRTHEEQTRLVTRFDTLTRHLQRIDGIDLLLFVRLGLETVHGGDGGLDSAVLSLELVDIESGHWPMFTRPAELAAILARAADSVA